MKHYEKLRFLQDNHFDLFLATHRLVENEISNNQTMFCCCGRLATGLHEMWCSKFKHKVNSETINRLKHLLPKNQKKQ